MKTKHLWFKARAFAVVAFMVASAAMLVAVAGCSNDDDDNDIRPGDVPAAVIKSFKATYPSATRVEWEKKGTYYVADFRHKGFSTDVWYTAAGREAMNVTDYDKATNMLPKAVLDAFRNGKYGNRTVDDIARYKRPDRTFYVIEVESPGTPDVDLYYSENGTLLQELPNHDIDITPDTVVPTARVRAR